LTCVVKFDNVSSSLHGKNNAADLLDQSRIGRTKKSKTGRETPKRDVDLIKERIKRLKEALK